jgi:hypothetical protein
VAVESPGPEGVRQDLFFRSSLVLQRPVLDPCLAVGFLPLPSGGLRVGQLVSMKWRVERLRDFEDEVSKHNVSQGKEGPIIYRQYSRNVRTQDSRESLLSYQILMWHRLQSSTLLSQLSYCCKIVAFIVPVMN